jgi:hypothetical protein
MNELEKALLGGHTALDGYLQFVSVEDFRRDIEEIRKKAALSTDAGRLREKIMEVLKGE